MATVRHRVESREYPAPPMAKARWNEHWRRLKICLPHDDAPGRVRSLGNAKDRAVVELRRAFFRVDHEEVP
jgi:hypothetical protein